MRVAIVSHGIFPEATGGMERHTFELAKYLSEHQFDVEVLVPETETPSVFPFSLVRLDWPRNLPWLVSYSLFIRAASRWIERVQPEVAWGQGPCLVSRPRSYDSRVVFHPHGLEMFAPAQTLSERIRSTPFRFLTRRAARKADSVISMGGAITSLLGSSVGVPSSKLEEIPNSITPSVDAVSSPARRPRSFLFVGRLVFNKGIQFLPKILRTTADLDYSLTMVGEGPLSGLAREMAQRDSRVTLVKGVSPDALRDLYRSHEILLFTSRYEGMPTVLLEALSHGCMALATRVGAVETFVSEANGLLVNPSAAAIADGIRLALSLPAEERKRRGLSGREMVLKNLTWSAVGRKYIDLLHRINRRSRA